MRAKLRLAFLLFFIVFTSISSAQPTMSAERILELVNSDRASHGLPELSLNPVLSLAALSKAEDMVGQNYFAHIGPEGRKPWDWFKFSGYEYTYAGENLAVGFNDPVELEKSWMSSFHHRANILSPYYDDLGLAIVKKDNAYLVVQFFGSRTSKVTLRQ